MRIVIIVVLVAAVALGSLAFHWLRGRRAGIGFREYVKNPYLAAQAQSDFATMHADIDRMAKLSPERLVSMLPPS